MPASGGSTSASTAAIPSASATSRATAIVAQVLDGIAAAKAAGLAVKINMVALKGLNEDEIAPMLRWCVERGPRPHA